jgi:hypothetical protein
VDLTWGVTVLLESSSEVSKLLALSKMFVLYSVWMKCIQNKIIISQKAFIIHIYGLHHYKGKLSKFHSQSLPYTGFQVLKVVDPNLGDNVLHITTQEKIQWG